jgi:hypothetical protein
LEEWLEYINDDKELELTNGNTDKLSEEFQQQPGFCEWNDHPTLKEPSFRPWFDYWKGTISTKNPDVHVISKMLQIASVLNARVQGDDGEIYTEEGLQEFAALDKLREELDQRNKKPWWKFW